MIKTAIKRVLVCAALAGFGAGASSAMAAMETFMVNIPATLAPNNPDSLGVSVPQFDPSLGTLTGISLQASNLSVYLTTQVFDFGAAGGYTGAYSQTTVTLTDPYNNTLTSSGFVNAGGLNGNPGFAGPIGSGQTLNLSGAATPTGLSSLLNPSVPSGDFAAFTGTGTETVDYGTAYSAAGISSGGSGPSMFFGSAGPTYSGTETVTYTYTSVPEPSCLGLLGVGAMALIRRRRNG
jgi:hypothetical protein